jgi:hypothetical protein
MTSARSSPGAYATVRARESETEVKQLDRAARRVEGRRA